MDRRSRAVSGVIDRSADLWRPADGLADAVLRRIEMRARDADEGRRNLSADIDDLRDAGVLRAALPPSAGGEGVGTTPAGARPCLVLMRQLGRANLSVARLVEGHINAVKLVFRYAGPSLCRRVAADVDAGALLGVWGADATPPVTLAGDRDEPVLGGIKRFASGLGIVAAALVTCRTDDGIQLALVPATDPARMDASAWRMSGMRATASGLYDVSGLRLDGDALVGAPDDYFREPDFEGGVWRYAAAHLGGAEALYTHMVRQLDKARRAGDPHQASRIAGAAIACEGARLWLERACQVVECEEGPAEDAAAYALLAREAVESACLTVIDIVDRALGTFAYDTTSPVERIRRDLSVFLRQAAPDAKRMRAARALVARQALPEAL